MAKNKKSGDYIEQILPTSNEEEMKSVYRKLNEKLRGMKWEYKVKNYNVDRF